MTAPVCRVQPKVVINQPTPVKLATIAPAQNNLESVVRTLNQLIQEFMKLAGQALEREQAQINTLRSSVNQLARNARNQGPSDKNTRWTEIQRVTKKVKVTNPDDDSQFVEVKRIQKLVLKDKVTGEEWVFNQ